MIKDYTLFADYPMVFLLNHPDDDLASDLWTTDDLVRKAFFGGHLVMIRTARDMDVPVRVEILPEAPALDLSGWDHIVEGSFRARGGRLHVMGGTVFPEDRSQTLPLAPGPYRVRVSMAGLGTLSEDGPGGEDRYRVQLWPAPWQEVRLRRMFDPDEDRDVP